jgi:transcriptional regulator
MYPPPHHQNNDRTKMIEVIKNFPLSMIVTTIGGKPFVSHIPLLYHKDTRKLTGHMDRLNPQVASLQNDCEVTLVFRGPDTYISPSIYTTKQLPTWNYIMVHLKGIVTVIEDPLQVKRTLIDLTRFLEAPEHKYQLEIDDPRMEQLVGYIHTFEITITHWEGKFKMSQDKCVQDQANANEQLMNFNREKIEALIESLLK